MAKITASGGVIHARCRARPFEGPAQPDNPGLTRSSSNRSGRMRPKITIPCLTSELHPTRGREDGDQRLVFDLALTVFLFRLGFLDFFLIICISII